MGPLRKGLLVMALIGTVSCQSIDPERDRLSIVQGLEFGGLPAIGVLRGQKTRCTGTLISSRRVLTAAHCFRRVEGAGELEFQLGKYASQPEARFKVARYWLHPAYHARGTLNDIAVLELTEDVPLSIPPLPLLPSAERSWESSNLFVVGYGYNDGVGQKGSGTKRAVWMPVSGLKKDKILSDPRDGRSTCQGDSGGPALVRWKDSAQEFAIVGVTVAGADTSCQSSSIFVRIDPYERFLANPEQSTDPGIEDPCAAIGKENKSVCSLEGLVPAAQGRYRLSCKADPWESQLIREDCQTLGPGRLCREGICASLTSLRRSTL